MNVPASSTSGDFPKRQSGLRVHSPAHPLPTTARRARIGTSDPNTAMHQVCPEQIQVSDHHGI